MSDQQLETNPGGNKLRAFIAFFALALLAVGQVYLYVSPLDDTVVIPPPFWFCIAGVLLFVASYAYRPSPRVQGWVGRINGSTALPWILAALALSGLTTLTMIAFQKAGRTNYIPVTTFWLFGAICYMGAFLHKEVLGAKIMEWLKTHWLEILLIGLLTGVAAGFRFYKLGMIPRVLDGDEGRIGLAVQSTSSSELANPFSLWENIGGLYLQAMNVAVYFFGPTAFGLRLIPAIGGTLAIPALYLFARQIAGRRIALIAACMLAISHTHIHFSRIASVGYIQSTWLVPLELYLLYSGLDRRSSWRTALGGIMLAIHFTIYLTSQIVLGMVLVFMVIAFFALRKWFRPALRQAAAFWGGFAVSFLPEFVYIMQNPNQFLNRLSADGTFQSGWLVRSMAETGESAFQILGERVIHAFLSLIYYPAYDFYGSPIPVLSLMAGMLFLIGLGVAIWRTRSPGFMLLNGYFWVLTMAVGIFALPPSADSYRMLMVLPAAMLMAATGFDYALDILGMGWPAQKIRYVFVSAITIFSLMIFNTWTYYGDFAGRCLYADNPAGRFASYLGSYLATVKSEANIYLLSNDTFTYGTHPSAAFLGQMREVINYPQPVDTLDAVSGEVIIANPDRIDELRAWARIHPGGELQYQYDCQSAMLMVYTLK
jgi:hypothetical protein